jgi:hypothetical protein
VGEAASPASLLYSVVGIILSTLYVVSGSRLILIGHDSLPNRLGIYWTRDATQVALANIQLALLLLPVLFLALIVAMQLSQDRQIRILIVRGVLFISLYGFARMALIIPARATGRAETLRSIWDLSKGNGLRIATAQAAAWIPGLLGHLFVSPSLGALPAAVALLGSTGLYLLSVLPLTVACIAYRSLSEAEPPSAAA